MERGAKPDWSSWRATLADTVAVAAERDAELLGAEADPIHPARIYGELVPRLAPDAVVVGDGGDYVSFAGKYVEPKQPGGWLDPGPYGCLGAGPGAAIAARLARPSSQVVLLPANSRVTVRVGEGRIDRFGVLVESLGAAPAPIVVEGAYYWSPGGHVWAAGGNLLATPLLP